jgi:DNA-binding response OmpR family regulator
MTTARDTIGVLLEQEGFRALLESDGKAGYERALATRPDLMLVDLRLPNMSGIEVCKQLRAARIGTPIIVLSAIGEELDKVLLLEIGADDYVVKPFGTRELLARIEPYCDGHARGASDRFLLGCDGGSRASHRQSQERRDKLTRAEYNLLTFFLQNPTSRLRADVILNSVWGYESFRIPAPSMRMWCGCGRNSSRSPIARATF